MSIQTINPNYLYSSEELTDYLNLSIRTIQRLLKNGILPSFRINGQYRIKGVDILSYLDSVKKEETNSKSKRNTAEKLLDLLVIYPITIELGKNLAKLLEVNKETELVEIMAKLRRKMVIELGFILPNIRFFDEENIDLDENEYNILINGVEVYKGIIDPEKNQDSLKLIVDNIELAAKKYAHEILSREDVFLIIEKIRKTHYIVVEEVISEDIESSKKLSIGQLTKILRELLHESISIRNMAKILEILADNINITQNTDELVEKVREGISNQICSKLANKEGIIESITLSETLEKELIEAVENKDPNNFVKIDIKTIEKLRSNLKNLVNEKHKTIICSPIIRKYLRNVLERNFPEISVLSYTGIYRDIKIANVAQLNLDSK